MPDDEDHLIQLAQAGDAAACAALYDRHYDAVFRYCFYRLCDEGLAQDLAAEVFVRMVAKLDRFQARGRPLLAWLYTVARNLIADHHRRERHRPDLSLDEVPRLRAHGDDLARGVDRKLQADRLAAAMRRLTEEQRRVILLKFMEELDTDEIARQMGKSEGAIKALQHRALGALRRALTKEGCLESGF